MIVPVLWRHYAAIYCRPAKAKGPVGATPYYCLVPPLAEVQARTLPTPEAISEDQAHLRAIPREGERIRPRKWNVP